MRFSDLFRQGKTEKPKVYQQRGVSYQLLNAGESIEIVGYRKLVDCPEVVTAIDTIARLIASMTIHLMENGDDGDKRLKNRLSKKIDINPNDYMTRSTFIYWVVKTLLIYGNAVVFPVIGNDENNGYLEALQPIPHRKVRYIGNGYTGYEIEIDGKIYSSDDVLNFVINPKEDEPWQGEGFKVALSDVLFNLKQASKTKRSFMSSKFKPSIIVRVDGMVEEFQYGEGKKIVLDDYVTGTAQGEPWLLPARQFDVKEVRPLTLNDLAINDSVEIDKKTVASIFGVPAFALGVGQFNRDEWNNFISSKIMPIAQGIEQEMTRKLLLSPTWYFKFNSRSLYRYDLKELADIANNQFKSGLMLGNEVRDWLGLSPLEGLDSLVILENYIPLDKVGDQNKLAGGQDE